MAALVASGSRTVISSANSAANTNTASSTLTTTATGLKNLVNADGSNMTAAAIRANAIVEVVYDGTKFVLLKRPINDRFAVLGSN